MSEPMQSVWIAFSRIPWGSFGWRMRACEDNWHAWVPWFRSLPEAEREAYKSEWSEPDGWKDCDFFIETGELLGWFLERQQTITDAAILPTLDENVINNYHRALWLIRQHFKRVGADRPLAEESIAELYRAPDGVHWRFSSHATLGGMRLVR